MLDKKDQTIDELESKQLSQDQGSVTLTADENKLCAKSGSLKHQIKEQLHVKDRMILMLESKQLSLTMAVQL